MMSPFPGMDPYLEQFWGDVHHTMINRSRAAILKQLPDDLVARVDERVFVEPSVVRRGWKPLAIEYYRLPLRERLPAIAIPLRQTDRDIPLDLQAVLDECAEEGRYVDDINYGKEPDPPLDRKDTEWADTLLRDQGLR